MKFHFLNNFFAFFPMSFVIFLLNFDAFFSGFRSQSQKMTEFVDILAKPPDFLKKNAENHFGIAEIYYYSFRSNE